MGGESPKPASTSTGAVFLSYASQDADAARRVCDALRTSGIEVWFDQSELRGGDAWDRRIRQEIHDCALFIPVISANTASRQEGYFRLEWDLADQRTHMLARNRPFIVPICVDATPDAAADVPESFQRVQWTRLPEGKTAPEFVERIASLLRPASAATSARRPVGGKPAASTPPRGVGPQRWILPWAVLVGVLACVAAYLVIDRLWVSKSAPTVTSPAPLPGTSGAAAEKSIAVLPFADMSEKKDQEYFADGLAEELLDLLAKTPGLHVIARTSSFSFKGKSDDIPTIAEKLKVANILEGSVRKSGNRLRVSTQLVRATDGEHLWSETYDREMKDIFKIQDEIAAAVVAALKLRLSPVQASARSRPTNTDAYLQYLLGQQYYYGSDEVAFRRAIAAYRQAITLDPQYAAAYAGLAVAEWTLSDATGDTAGLERATTTAERAVELAPDQPMGYAARAVLRAKVGWDWAGAQADLAKALELDPNDPVILRRYSGLLQSVGRLSESIAIARRVADLDPLSVPTWWTLTQALYMSGDLAGSREANRRALAIDPTNLVVLVDLGTIGLLDHRPAEALAAFQRIGGDKLAPLGLRLTGIAMAEHSLGHAGESRQALDEAIARVALVDAYQIAEACAWRGERDQAFAWLERAYRQRDGGLTYLKIDPLLASLHGNPRYKALLKKINLSE